MKRRGSLAGGVALLCLAFFEATAAARPDRSSPPAVGTAVARKPPAVQDLRLANGLRLVVEPRPSVPSAHLVWTVLAGSADDPPGEPGTAALLTETLLNLPEGASLRETLRARGVLLEVGTGEDAIRFSVHAPSNRLVWAVRRLRKALSRPPRAIVPVRSTTPSPGSSSGDPDRILRAAAWRAAWGEADAEGFPGKVSPPSSAKLGGEGFRAFHARHVRPSGMVVTAAGDVAVGALRRELERVRTVPAGDLAEAPGRAPAAERPRPRLVLVDRPGSGDARLGVTAALRGVPPLDPVALVTSHLLGGSGYSRLLGALRGELALAYDARAAVETRRAGSLFLAWSPVRVEDAAVALRRIVAEVDSLRREPPPEELTPARIALENRIAAGWFETSRSSARAWSRIASLGLDPEDVEDRLRRILEVSGEETARFAADHLGSEDRVLVVVGDAGALRGPLEDLGLGPPEVWPAEALASPGTEP